VGEEGGRNGGGTRKRRERDDTHQSYCHRPVELDAIARGMLPSRPVCGTTSRELVRECKQVRDRHMRTET
jgi:hypothetical protein